MTTHQIRLELESVACADDKADAQVTIHTSSDGARLTVFKVLVGSGGIPAAWLISNDGAGGEEVARLLRQSQITETAEDRRRAIEPDPNELEADE